MELRKSQSQRREILWSTWMPKMRSSNRWKVEKETRRQKAKMMAGNNQKKKLNKRQQIPTRLLSLLKAFSNKKVKNFKQSI